MCVCMFCVCAYVNTWVSGCVCVREFDIGSVRVYVYVCVCFGVYVRVRVCE
jgi:hypothetical protein